MPQCGDDWVKEAALAKFKKEERERVERHIAHERRLMRAKRQTMEDKCPTDESVANEYLNQEFLMVGVRTTESDWMSETRSCLAEIYGRRLYFYNFCEVDPAILTEKIWHIDATHYRIVIDDEGNPHLR